MPEHNHEHGPRQITEGQLRELRGKYFTIRHPRVPECNHKSDVINEPRHRNCQHCWFSWLESHPELVKVADEAYIEQGAAFLDKMRGRTFRVMFCRYMATKLKMQKEKEQDEQGNVSQGVLPEEQS